jgi:hypothetical protein
MVAALIATAAAFAVEQALDGVFGSEPGKLLVLVELAATAIVGGLTYVGLAAALRIPELGTILDLAIAVVRRRTISA